MTRRFRMVCAAPLLFLSAFAFGCSRGVSLHAVRGKVTFNGQPVAAGWVVFTPDTAQKNTGPQGFAAIKDGYFDTDNRSGRGTLGGPMVVKISAFDGKGTKDMPDGQPVLAPYETNAELPRQSTTLDLDIPASWGNQPIPAAAP